MMSLPICDRPLIEKRFLIASGSGSTSLPKRKPDVPFAVVALALSNKFMRGLPRNVATNTLAGHS